MKTRAYNTHVCTCVLLSSIARVGLVNLPCEFIGNALRPCIIIAYEEIGIYRDTSSG